MQRSLRRDIVVFDRALALSELTDSRQRTVYDYWQEKRKDRRMPARADLLPEDIGPSLGVVNLIDVTGPPWRFRFRLLGTEVVEAYGEDLTGQDAARVQPPSYAEVLLRQYAEVAEGAVPMLHELTFELVRERHSFTRLTLPLSADGERVNMLLCVSAFDAEFRRRALEHRD